MKVYGFPGSTCTRRVLMTLHEKNQPYEFITVDIFKGDQKQPAYLSLQPFSVVPVLDDDGFIMYESRAVMRYLDLKFKKPALTPDQLQAFAEMEQWLSIEQSYFSGPAILLIKQLYFNKMQGLVADTAIIEKAKPKVEHALDVAEERLSKTPYFAGDMFSLADMSWIPYVDYFFPAGLETLINTRPHIKTWWEKVSKRESVLKTSPLHAK